MSPFCHSNIPVKHDLSEHRKVSKRGSEHEELKHSLVLVLVASPQVAEQWPQEVQTEYTQMKTTMLNLLSFVTFICCFVQNYMQQKQKIYICCSVVCSWDHSGSHSTPLVRSSNVLLHANLNVRCLISLNTIHITGTNLGMKLGIIFLRQFQGRNIASS